MGSLRTHAHAYAYAHAHAHTKKHMNADTNTPTHTHMPTHTHSHTTAVRPVVANNISSRCHAKPFRGDVYRRLGYKKRRGSRRYAKWAPT
ncbi:hypothetical protein EVAR_31588_1 [Eumeta japonica]|uniref:Uncharacterized protein n=1 Tax=Eumeta variegata TaxID=151549 RepID=A0A4C1V788_EUMVA|nr:hypothetical protein EVAR_31588_1 [Eumeta japonica]